MSHNRKEMFSLDLNSEYWYDLFNEKYEEEVRKYEEDKQNQLLEINRKWNEQMDLVDDKTDGAVNKIGKSVHFPSESELARIYPMITWSYAYRNARKSNLDGVYNDQSFRHNVKYFFTSILSPIMRKEQRYIVSKRLHTDDTSIVQCIKYTCISADLMN